MALKTIKASVCAAALVGLRLLAWFCAGLFVLPMPAWSSEAELRVAFVYNFIKFIEWPALELSGPFRLCVLGAKDDMREALSPLHGRTVGKSTIELVHVGQESATSKLRACQMLYQVGKLTTDLPQPLPIGLVLVVNGENQITPNASIALMRGDDGRLEFAINQAAVSAAGVKMSSQLLKLAVNRQAGGAK